MINFELKNHKKVLIIGSGISGLTAGLYLSQFHIQTNIIDYSLAGGHLNLTDNIINFPGFIKVKGSELIHKIIKQVKNEKFYQINNKILKLKENHKIDFINKVKLNYTAFKSNKDILLIDEIFHKINQNNVKNAIKSLHNETDLDFLKKNKFIHSKSNKYVDFVFGKVTKVSCDNKLINVEYLSSKGTLEKCKYDIVVFATGSSFKKLNLPHEDELIEKRNIFTCLSCEMSLIHKIHTLVIVGGGNKGVENAITASNYVDKIYIIHKHNQLKANKKNISKLNLNKIKIILNSTIESFKLNELNELVGINVLDLNCNKLTFINTSHIVLAIGQNFTSNIETSNLLIKSDSGKIVSNHPKIFVCGDTKKDSVAQAVCAASSGCKVALEIVNLLNQIE